MTDIVERLRLRASGGPVRGQLDDEAAAEIERLHNQAQEYYEAWTKTRAENERLRAELARIRGLPRLSALDDEIERLRHVEADHKRLLERLRALLAE